MSNEDLKYEVIKKDTNIFDLSFKLIIVGNSGVGKSCLTLKAIKNQYDDFYTPTIGFEFLSFNVKINEHIIKLQIWDTCGQEAYRSIIKSFYKNSSLAIIVYSIDNKESFKALQSWLNEIKTESNPDIDIILVGNKSDLDEQREIEEKVGEKFCEDNNLSLFMETSAKTGLNAENLLIKAAQILYQKHQLDLSVDFSKVPYIPERIKIVGYDTDSDIDNDNENKRKNKCGC
jgi:small GTP-binding protein